MKPLLRGHFHQAMFFVALGAMIPIVVKSGTWAISIYGLCVLLMFAISSIYHRVNWRPEQRLTWRKLDHSGIYLMIAGTCTPIAYFGLEGDHARHLIITIWVVAALGIVQSLFFVNLPKFVSSIIYLIAGYLITPYLTELSQSLGPVNVGLIIAGGIAYSLGAIAYGLKRPLLNPKVFSYHEVFHLLVNVGATLHFIVIYSLV